MEWNLNCLRAIAELRTPLLDTLMQGVTELGGETLFMLFMLVVFWCVDKNKGYFLMLLCFTGTAVNQMLKITFCIPRPWVLDPSFEIVESARAGASGFSFPSGHTQNAVAAYGGMFCITKKLWVRVVCMALALLIPFSRLYLGVHTPLDVGVSFLIGWLLVLAIVVIYLVLGILYESFIHPLTILSGLPSAGFGALATLWLFGMDLNLYGFVGVIMLLGIVKKNAIMMLDFALEAQRHNPDMEPLEAITRGCHVRFRPIMMTTVAALMGALPIAIGIGAGAEARRPLGLAVVGGLCFSQIVTLYITPVYYYYMEKMSRSLGRRWGGRFRRPRADAPELAAKD